MEKLIVDNLNFSFGNEQILKNVSFSIREKEVVSFVGPSGSGKSTLLKICAGLLKANSGGLKTNFLKKSFAFQETRLLPWNNLIDNIALGINFRKDEKSILEIKNIAFKFGLNEEDFKKYPYMLSGGMKQRVSFARALIVKPDILFLDEPFSALDIGLKKELQKYLLECFYMFNMSIMMITHDLLEAIRISDRIFLFANKPGRIIKIFNIEKEKNNRTEIYVYQKMIELLKDKEVCKIFNT